MTRHALLFENGPIRIKACRYGPTMYLAGDEYIGRSFDLYGEFAQAEIDLVAQFIPWEGVALDIGANIGAHTLYYAQAVGPYGKVYSFEPQRGIYQILSANLALNGLLNTDAEHCGVGEEAGFATVPRWQYGNSQNFGGQKLIGYIGDGDQTPVITIDSLNLTRCDMIKIDVETMELAVLKGAHQTILRCQPVMYFENNVRRLSQALLSHAMSLGYRLFWHSPMMFNPRNFAGNPENVFSVTVDSNILCLPPRLPGKFALPPADQMFQPIEDPAFWPFEWE